MSIPKIFAPNSVEDWSENVTYVSPPSDWVKQSKFDLQTAETGGNFLREEYVIDRAKNIADYLPAKGQRNATYPNLTVVDSTVTDHMTAYQKLTVNFSGFLKKPVAKVPKEEFDNQIRDQIIYTKTGLGSITLRYLAPIRLLRYDIDQRPSFKNPYGDIKDFNDDIFVMCMVGPNGVELDNDQFDQLYTLFEWEVRTVRTLKDDVIGSVHRITETQERVVYQPGKVRWNIKGVFQNQGVQ